MSNEENGIKSLDGTPFCFPQNCVWNFRIRVVYFVLVGNCSCTAHAGLLIGEIFGAVKDDKCLITCFFARTRVDRVHISGINILHWLPCITAFVVWITVTLHAGNTRSSTTRAIYFCIFLEIDFVLIVTSINSNQYRRNCYFMCLLEVTITAWVTIRKGLF